MSDLSDLPTLLCFLLKSRNIWCVCVCACVQGGGERNVVINGDAPDSDPVHQRCPRQESCREDLGGL